MNKNIRIGFYVEDPTALGGVQRVTKNLIDLLKKEFEVPVIISLCGDTTNCVIDYNVEIKKIQSVSKELLYNVINTYRLTHVIVQMEFLKRGLQVSRAINSSGCKAINVLHNSPRIYFKKYGGIKHTFSSVRYIIQYFKMQLYWKAYHYSAFKELASTSGVICVSYAAADELKNILGHKYDDKITAIHNPLTFTPQICSGNKKNNVVYAGRLSFEKRPFLMLKVWKQVMQDVNDWDLYILGDGPSRRQMEKYVKKNHIEHVHFTGVVKNVDDYLKESKITILFSCYEGLPTVLLEAAACQNALLATISDGGTIDIVRDGETGLLCEPSVRQLTAAMLELMSDNVKLQEYSNAALKLMDEYQDEKILDQWKLVLR